MKSVYDIFIRDLEGSITEEALLENKSFAKIAIAVKNKKLSNQDIIALFTEGNILAQENKDEAQYYFTILSCIPGLSSRFRDLSTEASLILEGIEREEYKSLAEVIEKASMR